MRSSLVLTVLLAWVSFSVNAGVQVQSVRMWPSPDTTRLVLDLSGPVEHSLFSLKNPDRIVLDVQNASMLASLDDKDMAKSFLKNVRFARRGQNDLRIVLDLKQMVRPKSFLLRPHREYGYRLVIDLHEGEATKRPILTELQKADQARPVVVAIDAGHGGDDPGAIGRKGTREKDVVLAIAQKLKRLIDNEPGMKAVMVRTGDYYIPLQKRVDIARRHRADLFLSLHADAFTTPHAHGSSVYILSERRNASSDVAQFLAESENSADLIGGVSLDDKDDLLKMVLVDMVKTTTIEDSHKIASDVLSGLGGVTRLHKPHVEQAGFRVLKAPDVPSILIETAFISNPGEERKLRSAAHQQKLAQAIFKGTRSYFNKYPPQGTLIAMRPRQHRINRGDTLSAIASRYQVSVSHLRQVNRLKSDHLNVGATLHIPYSGS
ncbi:MAG: N-acetylmuramoyl-L-alanine amidase [Gammaproteobacteria bacterium]